MSHLYTIPADQCFVTKLAENLWARVNQDPMALAEFVIYLPTRRACRHLREAFLRVTNAQATLLPRMQPLGDVDEEDLDFMYMGALDELEPAIPSLRRQMLLVQCIQRKDPTLPLEQAASLALSLASLLDQAQTEGRDLKELEGIVPENLSSHWQNTLSFLEVLLSFWPELLKAEGCMDPAARRNLVLEKQAEAWRKTPPTYPIIAAGSTGSHPAVGRLMAVIADLPKGEVVLPALDLMLEEDAWQAIDETHPQYTMKTWLEKSSFDRSDVCNWPSVDITNPARLLLLQESMRPASVTETWQHLKGKLSEDAFDGLEVINADHHREEAEVIALRLRSVLEEKGKTAALITPDRSLAARVSAALGRWGVFANDSAGTPLSQWPVGSFLKSILAMSVPDVSPVATLTVLKHPLARAGIDTATCRSYARSVELACWRGVRPKNGIYGAAQLLHEKQPKCAAWLLTLQKLFAPLTDPWEEKHNLKFWIDAHLKVAQALAAEKEDEETSSLWRGEDGEAALSWLDEWLGAGADLDDMSGAEYAALFDVLIDQVQVRPAYGMHPRLQLLGPLEARLLHHDLVILGGMNETTWPPSPSVDPWLSRPMKRSFGLPTPERRVGLSAHDFAQLASSKEVVLTRAGRVGGSPTVPSRFLLQVNAVTQAAGFVPEDVLASKDPWQEWAAALDEPDAYISIDPPCPTPPVSVRPTSLRVTEISTWMRNPYAIYAKHILKLKKLDDIDADISAADFGTVIHEALENFVRSTQTKWPENPLKELLKKGREAFASYEDRPQVMAFWWPRFESMAHWFVDYEEKRRAIGTCPVVVEGDATLSLLQDSFTVRGRVDRIDRKVDGSLVIIDYKTGQAPSEAEVLAGYEPQLSLMGLMARAGAFEKISAADVDALEYWAVMQRDDKKKIRALTKDVSGQMVKAKEGIETLIRSFQDPSTPYEAAPKPKTSPRYNDYEHLSRMVEWGRVKGSGS